MPSLLSATSSVARGAYEIHVWGTVLYIEAASTTVDRAAIDAAIVDVEKFVRDVDEKFSTYKENSFVSRLRRGEVEISDASEDVQAVWAACESARYISDRAFDPWKVEGGFFNDSINHQVVAQRLYKRYPDPKKDNAPSHQ